MAFWSKRNPESQAVSVSTIRDRRRESVLQVGNFMAAVTFLCDLPDQVIQGNDKNSVESQAQGVVNGHRNGRAGKCGISGCGRISTKNY